MLATDGTVKILDLGLALVGAEHSDHKELTQDGQILGTADFIAPEQFSNSHKVDIRADIYGLGCALFKLLTGEAPFTGPQYADPLRKMKAHAEAPIPSILEKRSDVPIELSNIMSRLLAKHPGERYATPSDVADVLEPFTKLNNVNDLAKLPCERELEDGSIGTEELYSTSVGPSKPSDDKTEGRGDPLAHSSILEKKPSPRTGSRRQLPWLLSMATGLLFLVGSVIYIQTGKGQLVLTVNEPDITVTIDKKPQDVFARQVAIKSPRDHFVIKLPVETGEHKLEVTKEGFIGYVQGFRIERNGHVELTALLKPKHIQEPLFERIIDDGDIGYSELGDGWNSGNADLKKAHQGDYRVSVKSARVARWSFDQLEPGYYEVFSTWNYSPNRAKNAAYAVYDGDRVLRRIQRNQLLAPDDAHAADQDWESLGTFEIKSRLLIVEVDATRTFGSPRGGVIADAARIVKVKSRKPRGKKKKSISRLKKSSTTKKSVSP